MSENGFVDYYELLQVSSNADIDTIERVFRHLAKKLHPDNKETADSEKFQQVVEAHPHQCRDPCWLRCQVPGVLAQQVEGRI